MGDGRTRPYLSVLAAPLIGLIALLGTLAVLPDASAQVEDDPPNVLLLIADDFGVESSPCYDYAPLDAPRLEAFCEEAVVFDNAWASPICSPTRSGILTGRHSFRTGMTEQVTGSNGLEIADSEWTLPKVFDAGNSGYATANFGKWHLGGSADKPARMGWDHFSGLLVGGLTNYSNWTKTVNATSVGGNVTATTEPVTNYATSENVDDALAWIDDQTTPWLTWIGFNAPHTPFHLPPADLHTKNLSGTAADIEANPELYYAAAVEALDTEIGRLVDSIDPEELANTTIIFIGDNGNPAQVSSYGRGMAKGTIHEGGVHVPMMVWGAGVEDGGRRTDALVSTVDIFATVTDLAEVNVAAAIGDAPPIDAKSFAHVLTHDGGQNEYLMTEIRGEVTDDQREGRAIRNSQYKVILFDDGRTRFYDLIANPRGDTPINARTDEQDAVFDELSAVLQAWTASPDAPPPDPLEHDHGEATPTPDPGGLTPTPDPGGGGLDLTALPLGDGKVSTQPEVGSVFACQQNFNGGGAQAVGPWIDEVGGTWSLPGKTVTVSGSVNWNSEFSVTLNGSTRIISTNDLPNHPTGVFPVAADDDAYQYDRNPNTIEAQSIVADMPAIPAIAAQAACAPQGIVGYLLTGAVFYNGLDARGNDAVAHEIQDDCQGHPQQSGTYHYHSLSECLDDPDTGAHSALVGYATDGFGLYGRYGEGGEVVTNADLDECHGHTHTIEWDGTERSIYHYHATYEYPYTVACLRGTEGDPGATPTAVPPTPTPAPTVVPTPGPGVPPGADSPVEVMHVVTCLGPDGRVDTNIVNTGLAAAAYRIEFQGLTARQTTVAAGDWWRMPITGRPDDTFDVRVLRDGVVVSDTSVTVNCDGDPASIPGPEIQVVNACRAGNGYVLFQFANDAAASKPYVIEFEGVPNRSTTAAAYGGAVRAVTGRPNGIYDITIRSGSTVVAAIQVTVGC